MNRFLKGACVISVLGLAYAANADPQFTFSGKADKVCKIDTISGGAVGALETATGSDYKLNFSPPGANAFANSVAVGTQTLSGDFFVGISGNTTCTYTLKSDNGALWNDTNHAARRYKADIFVLGVGSKDLQDLNSDHSALTTVRSSLVTPPPIGSTLGVAFTIPDTEGAMLPAGTYTDTLRLTLTP
jgi:hypothetical protein